MQNLEEVGFSSPTFPISVTMSCSPPDVGKQSCEVCNVL